MRKTIISITLLIFVLIATSAQAAEYSATMVTKSSEGTFKAKIFVKGKWHRHEQPEAVILFDEETGKTYSIVPAEKIYIEMGEDEESEESQSILNSPEDLKMEVGQTMSDEDGKIERLPSETVGKYRCDVYRHTPQEEDFGPSTIWFSPKLKTAVKAVSETPMGTITMEYVEIKEGPQDEKLFTIPEGYSKMELNF